jgi:hypothetical protein
MGFKHFFHKMANAVANTAEGVYHDAKTIAINAYHDPAGTVQDSLLGVVKVAEGDGSDLWKGLKDITHGKIEDAMHHFYNVGEDAEWVVPTVIHGAVTGAVCHDDPDLCATMQQMGDHGRVIYDTVKDDWSAIRNIGHDLKHGHLSWQDAIDGIFAAYDLTPDGLAFHLATNEWTPFIMHEMGVGMAINGPHGFNNPVRNFLAEQDFFLVMLMIGLVLFFLWYMGMQRSHHQTGTWQPEMRY